MIIDGSRDRQLETLLDKKDYQLVTCDPLVLCPFQTYGSRQFLALDILIENISLETGQKGLTFLLSQLNALRPLAKNKTRGA